MNLGVRPAFACERKIRAFTGKPNSQGVQINLMTSKLVRFLIAAAFVLPAAAQTAPAPLPAAPSAAAAAAPLAANATGTKVGTINLEQAIFASNEGQREFDTLSKKLEPKQTELKGMNDEVESLKKQLSTQGDKLNDDARGTLVKQIEDKQKKLERSVQDARDDAQNQQSEIGQRILQKMGPLIVKYAADNGFGVIIDTSNPWPQGPVLWAGPSVDITRAIVETYNAQSGVPPLANAKPPATTRPSAPLTKPATPAAATPPKSQGAPK